MRQVATQSIWQERFFATIFGSFAVLALVGLYGVLATAALLAGYLSARRATRVDRMLALREESRGPTCFRRSCYSGPHASYSLRPAVAYAACRGSR